LLSRWKYSRCRNINKVVDLVYIVLKKCYLWKTSIRNVHYFGGQFYKILESSRYIHLDDEPSNIVLFTIYEKKIASLMQIFRYCILTKEAYTIVSRNL